MLRDLEELDREQGVEALFQHRAALLERQLGDVGDEHVLVEAAALIEDHSGPQLVRLRGLENGHEDVARFVASNHSLQRLVEAPEHFVVARDDLEQLGRVLHVEEDGAGGFLLRHRLEQARGDQLKEHAGDFELGHLRAANQFADGQLAVDLPEQKNLRLAQIELLEVGRDAVDRREDHFQAGDLLPDAGRLVESPDPFHDDAR